MFKTYYRPPPRMQQWQHSWFFAGGLTRRLWRLLSHYILLYTSTYYLWDEETIGDHASYFQPSLLDDLLHIYGTLYALPRSTLHSFQIHPENHCFCISRTRTNKSLHPTQTKWKPHSPNPNMIPTNWRIPPLTPTLLFQNPLPNIGVMVGKQLDWQSFRTTSLLHHSLL